MPNAIHSTCGPDFRKSVNFAGKLAAQGRGVTVARFKGMPEGGFKGPFAAVRRLPEPKAADDQVRDPFKKPVADMFGGGKVVPDTVRGNMKQERAEG